MADDVGPYLSELLRDLHFYLGNSDCDAMDLQDAFDFVEQETR